MSNLFNATNQIINKSQYETYNTGCSIEVQKCMSACVNFQAKVINTLHDRIVVALIILAILLMYQFYTKYHKPQYSLKDWYIRKIDYRIDYIIGILIIGIIGLLFL